MNETRYHELKKILNIILDVVLGILAVIVLIFMARYLLDLWRFIFEPVNSDNFTIIMSEITSFFMLFEFVMMIVRYIQEGHHIPIRYLILISLTAILRQLLVIHGEAEQTLLLSISILLLVIVLYILNKVSTSFHNHHHDQENP
ncbi:phosphate-starvation-inducible protein PsiE [Enterococcus sp. LJL90]